MWERRKRKCKLGLTSTRYGLYLQIQLQALIYMQVIYAFENKLHLNKEKKDIHSRASKVTWLKFRVSEGQEKGYLKKKL